jgi:hypothetical protein
MAGAWSRIFVPLVAALLAPCGAVAHAADGWPAPGTEALPRDAGGGLAILPLVCWWLWIAAWATTSDWVSRDSRRFNVRPDVWTGAVIMPFVIASLVAWWVPWAAAGQAVMALAWLVPLLLYARERNPKTPPAERIFTRNHLGRTVRAALRRLGVKVAQEAVIDSGLPYVKLLASGGATAEENQAWQEAAVGLPGFEAATKLVQEACAARATLLVLEATGEGVKVGHEVDGLPGAARYVKTPAKGMGKSRQPDVWGDAPPLEAAAGAAAVAALRAVAGATDSARLAGGKEAAFTAEVDMKKRPCRLSLRTTKTSQQVVVAIDMPPFAPKKLEDLGMSAEMVASIRDLLAREKGLFLVSSPPAAGGSTLFDMVLMTADRLLRDFVSIESAAAPAKEVQNVKPVRFDPSAGESPVDALNKAMLEYPAAVVTRDISDKQLAASLLDLADDQRLIVVGVRAADAVDAIEKLLALGVPRDQLARCLLGSVSQRLIRKLCPQCGDPQPASPELLQRLKRTAEEVPSIKRASPHGGCRTCAGRQFMGRTAIFELAGGPTVKQAIAKGVDGKVLRQAAIKDGMRPLADAGLAMVAAGECSLDELQRVFAVKKEAGPAGVKR